MREGSVLPNEGKNVCKISRLENSGCLVFKSILALLQEILL